MWCGRRPCAGETDTELAEKGVAQAQATADLLAERLPQGVRYILCSDLKRARATAEIYAKRFGVEVIVEPRLREPSLGRFEGMTKEPARSDRPRIDPTGRRQERASP